MKKSTAIIVLLLLVYVASGQTVRTFELKPITKQGWKYFYDLKKVSSPVALEVPLIAVNDDVVNLHMKRSRTYRQIGTFVTLVPVIYLLTLPKNQYVDQQTFWWVFGSTIAAQIGFEALYHVQVGKAVERYNTIIMRPSGSSLGIELTYRFW